MGRNRPLNDRLSTQEGIGHAVNVAGDVNVSNDTDKILSNGLRYSQEEARSARR